MSLLLLCKELVYELFAAGLLVGIMCDSFLHLIAWTISQLLKCLVRMKKTSDNKFKNVC